MKSFKTIADIRAALVRTSSALINANGQAFYQWQSNRLGNDLFINDPDRANRIHEAAEDGCDGSTHAEHLEDFREYAKEYFREITDAAFNLEISDESAALDAEIEAAEQALSDDLDALELWHEKAGSLHQQAG